MSNAVIQVGPLENAAGKKALIKSLLAGSFGSEEISALKAWTDGMRDAVKESSAGKAKSVNVLIDISKLETYSDPVVIEMLTSLVKEDAGFIYRTASFGGTAMHEIAQSVIRGITDRNNIQNFPTEKEARVWLES